MAVRAPHLYRSLRCFCLAGFSLLAADVEDGAEIPFSFEEHAARGNASLYEYRPLVRSYVDARAERLSALADAGIVLEELRREPAAAIYAAAHAGKGDVSLLRTVALPLLADVAEACGGLDWSDEAFDRAYAELERVLGEAARLMRASLEHSSDRRATYRRAGRPCPRCGSPIRSRGQGDDNRTAYWCPGCQRGEDPPSA